VHLAFGYIDMRKGINGLAMLVQGLRAAAGFPSEVERPAGMSRKPSAPHYGANATRGP